MRRRTRGAPPSLDSTAIDSAYGLEPVFEPDSAATEVGSFAGVDCPYCGEHYETPVDLTAGSFQYVEDCQVCCQPIELSGEIGPDGALKQLTSHRLD